MSLSWYINRLRTFSAGEILFRMRQYAQNHFFDRFYSKKRISRFQAKSSLIESKNEHKSYPIFEERIDIYKPIDWHLDIQSGKRFPLTFTHQISIRSDKFGSAKHVWEVNRLLFLTYIAYLYKQSEEIRYLHLFMYHLASWKNCNPYLKGVNWYSNIEVNIRLINWLYCWKLLNAEFLMSINPEFQSFVRTVWKPLIDEHAEYSFRHPSLYSSSNNHLISEYAGLFVSACTWEIPHRKNRMRYAQKGLEREILLQNTQEGINREEAAEYIQFIDEFFLIAAIVGQECGCPFSPAYLSRLHQMATYLDKMLDVHGNYPMYGDGDDGFILRLDDKKTFNNFTSILSAFAAFFKDESLKRTDAAWTNKCSLLLGKSGKAQFEKLQTKGNPDRNSFFPQSGHFVFRKREGAKEVYLHFDAAPLGYLSIAAHGHADALSFILHVDGHPILVDSGTFTYHTHKEWREYFVGTLAHNTIRVNGKNQATLAGPTMWRNHFHIQILDVSENAVSAVHDGYAKMGVSHMRKVLFDSEQNEFSVEDFLQGTENFQIEMPFHLHPEVRILEEQGSFLLQTSGARSVRIFPDRRLHFRIAYGEEHPVLGWYSEHFGEKVKTGALYAELEVQKEIRLKTRIQILND